MTTFSPEPGAFPESTALPPPGTAVGGARFTGGGLPGAIAAEWTKVWSVRSTWWSLLAAALLTAAGGLQFAIYTANGNTNADPSDDKGVVTLGSLAIQAMDLGQFAVIALAMLVITAEYSSGTIRTTLQWVPRRGRMLLAKAAVVAVLIFVAGVLLGVLGMATAAPLLGRWGTFALPQATSDALAIGLYLALVGVFALGIGAMVRSAVGTLIIVFLILTVLPALLGASNIEFVTRVADGLPSGAGHHFMQGDSSPYPPLVGLVLLTAWAVASVGAGYVVLRRRDA
jgi:ABC-2 type transport system permease protein